jgi:hypothetical protein
MTDMQSKILARVEQVIRKHGLDYVVKSQYVNTGTVYAMDDDLNTIVAASYDFQGDRWSFSFGNSPQARNTESMSPHSSHGNYDDGTKLRAMLDRWDAAVAGWRSKASA